MDIICTEIDGSGFSFDDVHDLLWRANENNRNAGFFLRTSELSGEDLRARVGDGKCFVAIANRKMIGTASVRLRKGRYWYHSGEYVSYMLAAVLPEYQGMHVNTALAKKVFDFARDNRAPMVQLARVKKTS